MEGVSGRVEPVEAILRGQPLPPPLFDAKEAMAEVRIGDIKLSYRDADGGGRHYLQRGPSEEYYSAFYPLLRQALAPGLCVDIGANYGFTGLLMRRAFPDSSLTLVEPVPWLEGYIRHNFYQNGLQFDHLHSAICSTATAGDVSEFGVNERGTQDSRVIPQPGMQRVKTRVVTLDQLTADTGSETSVYVKIDTQGWEQRVFAGGENFLDNHDRWLIKTEFAPDWLTSQGTNPVVLLRWLLDRFEVYESTGRQRWNCASLAEMLGTPLLPSQAADFVPYVSKLALQGKGWVDLYVLPPAHRRSYALMP